MIKVFLVDDEPFLREGLKAVIPWEEYGFTICGEAENGEEALKAIETLKPQPQLILTDIKMPGMNGLEFIEHAKNIIGGKVDFIILSGYSDFNYAQSAIKYGVKNYLLKPIDEEELIEDLKKISKEFQEEVTIEKGNTINSNKVIKALFKEEIDPYILKYSKIMFKVLDSCRLRYMEVEMDRIYLLEKFNEDSIKAMFHQCYDIIKQTVKFDNTNNIYEDKIGEYGIIISDEILKNYDYSLNKFVLALQKNLEDFISCSCYISIGKEISDVNTLKASYASCEQIKEFRNYVKKPIVYFEELENEQMKKEISANNLLKAINDGNLSAMQENSLSLSREFFQLDNYGKQAVSIYAIEKYIKDNYQKELTLKKLSEEFYISPVYLGQLFKKSIGMYFNDYLHFIRIEEAKKLLRRTDLKLYEIANKVGYGDPNYFISKFEKITNISPTEYKKLK